MNINEINEWHLEHWVCRQWMVDWRCCIGDGGVHRTALDHSFTWNATSFYTKSLLDHNMKRHPQSTYLANCKQDVTIDSD